MPKNPLISRPSSQQKTAQIYLQTGAIPLSYLLTGALNELFLSFEGYLTHKIHYLSLFVVFFRFPNRRSPDQNVRNTCRISITRTSDTCDTIPSSIALDDILTIRFLDTTSIICNKRLCLFDENTSCQSFFVSIRTTRVLS